MDFFTFTPKRGMKFSNAAVTHADGDESPLVAGVRL